MWTEVLKDASLCLKCRVRINYCLLRQAPYCLRPHRPNARSQSTVAAVAEDHGVDHEEPQSKHRRSKKAEERLRRKWKPPSVAELGVSSLGKPAEVLVLKDRDRQIPATAEDEAGRSKGSQSQILEALQAENGPLSSKTVKQNLDQVSKSYLNQSKVLSVEEGTKLKELLLAGFTQNQLRSYCEEGDPSKLVNLTGTMPSNREAQTQAFHVSTQAKAFRKRVLAASSVLKLGKAGLVDYIIKYKWGLANPAGELIEHHIPIEAQKLEYLLSHKHSVLKKYAKEFKVAIEASREYGSIHIVGNAKHVALAQDAMNSFCNKITISPVRSAMSGRDLKRFATSDFLNHLNRKHDVMISWAPRQDTNSQAQEDWLTIYYHKTQDLQNALNAERAILLAERDFLAAEEDRYAQPKVPSSLEKKVSMWVFKDDREPERVLHHAPENSNKADRQKAWNRWAFPQQPKYSGYIDPRSEFSSAHQMHQYLGSLNKQWKFIHKILTFLRRCR